MKAQFNDNSNVVINSFLDEAKGNMKLVMESYRLDLKKKLDSSEPRSGRLYEYVENYRNHRASAEGEPPAPLSRDLLNSIKSDTIEDSRARFKGVVYSNLPYAIVLELFLNRPAWKVTLEENRDKYAKLATEGFNRR